MPDLVRHNPDRQRFELDADGELAIASYTLADRVMSINHTAVPDHLEGRGIGSRLARGALAIARRDGFKIVPRCSFIRAFIRRNPEFQDLVAG
jgi:predicted GNAT family acetyltransferase